MLSFAEEELERELAHDLVCEVDRHPHDDPCGGRANFKISAFDTTCHAWRARLTCSECAGTMWMLIVEGRFCSCPSEHTGHGLIGFRMESIR